MQRNYKLARATKELNDNARKHLGDVEIPITAPDAGATAEETVANLLASAGGDHKNLRNIYNGGGFFLAVQKNLKSLADGIGDRIENGEITKEQGVQELVDAAASVPTVTLRGEGAPRKGTSKAKEAGAAEATNALRDKAAARVEALSGREKAIAQKLFEDMFGSDAS
jgi:hypothetical protein